MDIKAISSREILDSRGNPAIETRVELTDGSIGLASVPSGASTGKYEAFELRDNDPSRYEGLGVTRAIENVTVQIQPKLIGQEAGDQEKIDGLLISLDGTENKSRLGSNSILSVSLAVARAQAVSHREELYRYLNRLAGGYDLPFTLERLPTPTFNLINGGKHGAGNLDFQEFHVIPTSRVSFSEALEMGAEIYQSVKKILEHRGAIHSVGDEGGFAPNLFTNADALEILTEAVSQTRYRLNGDVFLGIDSAASGFYREGRYFIKDQPQPLSADDLIAFYRELINQYSLISLEDPLDQDAWNDWTALTERFGDRVTIVGDDLLVTNPKRLAKAIEAKAANAILVKPNQIGTLTEVFTVIRMARSSGWKISLSHRSGETNDTFIADLAVAVGADYVKFGAPARGERVAKYNRLLEIEPQLVKK